jgi:hypothetical protein
MGQAKAIENVRARMDLNMGSVCEKVFIFPLHHTIHEEVLVLPSALKI